MNYVSYYDSPLGKIILTADNHGLTALIFDGDKYFRFKSDCVEKISPVISRAERWLKIYFSGREPDFMPPLNLQGTPFRIAVWQELLKIPYGTTKTYGDLAKALNTSARAIGGAVAHNEISIIIPCHRIIGGDGKITGYSGGIERKIKLLELEKNILDEKGRIAHG